MSEKKMPDLKPLVDGLKAKKAKRDKVKENAKENAKEKGKVKALTDKQRIDVIWEYLGLDE